MIRTLAPLAAALALASPAAAAVYTGVGGPIPDNGFRLSTIEILDSFQIEDVNLRLDGLAHNYSGDLQFYLSKGEVTVQLFKNYGFNFYMRGSMGFDDEAATPITSYPTVLVPTYRPTQALSAFDGLDAKGIWTLKVADTSGGSSGAYTGWSLDITPVAPSAAVPEPASWALMILGFGAAGAMLRQRREVLAAL